MCVCGEAGPGCGNEAVLWLTCHECFYSKDKLLTLSMEVMRLCCFCTPCCRRDGDGFVTKVEVLHLAASLHILAAAAPVLLGSRPAPSQQPPLAGAAAEGQPRPQGPPSRKVLSSQELSERAIFERVLEQSWQEVDVSQAGRLQGVCGETVQWLIISYAISCSGLCVME